MDRETVPSAESEASRNEISDQERNLFGRGDYRSETASEMDERRRQGVLNAVATVAIGAVQWIGAAVVVVAFFGIVIMSIHYLAPSTWRWLTPDEIKRLETLVTGVAFSIIAVYSRNFMK